MGLLVMRWAHLQARRLQCQGGPSTVAMRHPLFHSNQFDLGRPRESRHAHARTELTPRSLSFPHAPGFQSMHQCLMLLAAASRLRISSPISVDRTPVVQPDLPHA